MIKFTAKILKKIIDHRYSNHGLVLLALGGVSAGIWKFVWWINQEPIIENSPTQSIGLDISGASDFFIDGIRVTGFDKGIVASGTENVMILDSEFDSRD